MTFRPLDPIADCALIEAFFHEAADYILLERGEAPGPQVTEEFFADAPPGIDPASSYRAGYFADDRMIALADLSFGYPDAHAAYIGLLIVSPAARNHGAGALFLRHLEDTARARGARRLYLGVLESNLRGRAFWEREGFAVALANRPITIGRKAHIAHRMGKDL